MKLFRDFLKGFKPKYRVSHDRELGLKTHAFTSPAEGEVILYETYFRRMRQTGKTNLNLDVVNLVAYPPSKKLHSQLLKYPQEVIPAMDQVLKDLMLDIADMDHQAGLEGMQGEEGEEEIGDIMGKVYKVRPFGLPAVNMRSLNPSGLYIILITFRFGLSLSRYGQTRLYQRSSHSCHTRYSRHESGLLPLSDMFAHRAG
jgi:DNA replication licensing factor MCM4